MDERERLRMLEAEVRQSSAAGQASVDEEMDKRKKFRKPAMRRKTKQKILVGVALILTFLLVWSKVRIHFVVFTSFWGFLGILLAVFALVYVVIKFFFDTKDEGS